MSKPHSNTQKGRNAQTVKVCTDGAAREIWLHLLSDFQQIEGADFRLAAKAALDNGISCFREYQFPEMGIVSPARYKRGKQLESLFKKYRFTQDMYTETELTERTLEKFSAEQTRFASVRPCFPALAGLVIRRARRIARSILGKYNPEIDLEYVRFGRKSSIGCPLASAYIDHKLTNAKAFTSSSQCVEWLKERILSKDSLLLELMTEMGIPHSCESLPIHDSLNLILAPKSWKIHRPITPLTLVGLYYTYGVGGQIQSALKAHRLDITRLQAVHQALVQKNSVSMNLATADLRSASQSLVSELLNGVLPRDWYNAIKLSFSHQVVIDGKATYCASVLPMGNGLTFPTETLVFYVLLKAISELSKVRGRISVYGDDLIYPSRLHKYVAKIFPLLGCTLNLDKTFVKAPFRESCGSDFYRGADVRPMFLPDTPQHLTPQHYTVFLYKCVNSLLRRWDPSEIEGTLRFLLQEIMKFSPFVLRVPPSFPDTAGVKLERPEMTIGSEYGIKWSPVNVLFYSGSKWFHFHYLHQRPKDREVESAKPYYWLALQGRIDDIDLSKNFWDIDIPAERPQASLKWVCLKYKRPTIHPSGRTTLQVVKKVSLVCASRLPAKIVDKETRRETVSDWL